LIDEVIRSLINGKVNDLLINLPYELVIYSTSIFVLNKDIVSDDFGVFFFQTYWKIIKLNNN
jgi:hypothetical protein